MDDVASIGFSIATALALQFTAIDRAHGQDRLGEGRQASVRISVSVKPSASVEKVEGRGNGAAPFSGSRSRVHLVKRQYDANRQYLLIVPQ